MSVAETTGTELAMEVDSMLNEFDIKVIAYVKDGGSNLATCTSALKKLVSNPYFENVFAGPCIAHIISGACNAAMKVTGAQEFICVDFKKCRQIL